MNTAQEYMNALTNEFSRGHFQEALRFGWMLLEDPTLQEELRGDPRRLGIIHRDMAAAYGRLGMTEERDAAIRRAEHYHNADIATRYRQHYPRSCTPESEWGRGVAHAERAATATYVGMFALEAALLSGDDGARSLSMMRDAMRDMEVARQCKHAAKDYGPIPLLRQYETNLSPRWSMAESLYGDRQRGLALAGRAIHLALSSESEGHAKGMTSGDIMRARLRGVARGMAAVAVNVCARLGMAKTARTITGKVL